MICAFRIPNSLGAPGAPADLTFDTESAPPSAVVPFGRSLVPPGALGLPGGLSLRRRSA